MYWHVYDSYDFVFVRIMYIRVISYSCKIYFPSVCIYKYVYEMLTVNEVCNVRVCNIHTFVYVGLIVFYLMYAQVYDRCVYLMYNVVVYIFVVDFGDCPVPMLVLSGTKGMIGFNCVKVLSKLSL